MPGAKRANRQVSRPSVSIIIPVYNEVARLANLSIVAEFLGKLKKSSELIVVNDGSTDQTLAKLRRLRRKHPFNLITYSQNRGKGYAIAQGMMAAHGKQCVFMDVDLSVPIESLDRLLKVAAASDIVIGTRKTASAQVTRRQHPIREKLGMGYTWLTQAWLGVPVSDFTCGFKCFSKPAAMQIFSQVKLDRWGFDSEVLFLAQRQGWQITELPVTWQNDPRSKVKIPQDVLRSLRELWLIRWHQWRGRYHF